MRKNLLVAILVTIAVLYALAFTACVEPKPEPEYFTVGLEYEKVEGGYEVKSRGTTTDRDIVIPAKHEGEPVVSIGSYAFADEYCIRINSVVIPDSVTYIDFGAFRYCSNLKNITIPDSVTAIGDDAFMDCTRLAEINLPDTKISLHSEIFKNTAYYENASNWEDGVLYIGNHLIAADKSISGGYSIKEGTLTIAQIAFARCNDLTFVTVPESVILIGWGAFFWCNNLLNVTFENCSVSIAPEAFSACGFKSLEIPDCITEIEKYAFKECNYMLNLTVSGAVNDIGEEAFILCQHLISVSLGDGLKTIGERAFYDCCKIQSITIPSSVTSIGKQAFSRCRELEIIIFKGTKARWEAIEKGENWDYDNGDYVICCTDGKIEKVFNG